MVLSLESSLAKLRRKAQPVDQFGAKLDSLIDHMIKTMQYFHLPSLSGPEVDVPLQIVIVDTSHGTDPARPSVLVNPIVTAQSTETMPVLEGCPCLHDVEALVNRPAKVSVEGFDSEGRECGWRFEGLKARQVCHQIDPGGYSFCGSFRDLGSQQALAFSETRILTVEISRYGITRHWNGDDGNPRGPLADENQLPDRAFRNLFGRPFMKEA